jgi:hypothetical protein
MARHADSLRHQGVVLGQATAATSAAGNASDPASMATVRKLPRHL